MKFNSLGASGKSPFWPALDAPHFGSLVLAVSGLSSSPTIISIRAQNDPQSPTST